MVSSSASPSSPPPLLLHPVVTGVAESDDTFGGNLLREWRASLESQSGSSSRNNNHNNSSSSSVINDRGMGGVAETTTTTTDSATTTTNTPPVAPAVVMSAEDRRTTTTSYPVATYVRDWMDQVSQVSLLAIPQTFLPQHYTMSPPPSQSIQRDERQQQQQQQHRRMISISTDDPSSTRSENDIEALAAAYSQQASFQTSSARNMHDALEAGTEYLLVDGDLIEMPPPLLQDPRQEEIKDRIRRQQQQQHQQPQSSVTNPMRRGVRKISKFFKRVRRGTSRGETEPDHSATTTTSAGAGDYATAVPLPSTSIASTTSDNPDDGSLSKKKNTRDVKRKKKGQRLSWRRTDDNDNSLNAAVTGLESQSRRRLTAIDSNQDYLHPHWEESMHQDPLSPPPPRTPAMHEVTDSTGSVAASYVGPADQISGLEAAGLVMAADVAFIDASAYDMSYWKKDDGSLIPSMLTCDSDYKVAKDDAPDVESMLMRAAHETTVDLDSADMPTARQGSMGQKSEGGEVFLSQAGPSDMHRTIVNDTLKMVLVAAPEVPKSWLGRTLRGCHKRPRERATLGVDVHRWAPHDDTKFLLWDVQGATGVSDDSPNFGAHPGTQSLFFSPQTLYILVSDLAFDNPLTFVHSHMDHLYQEDEDNDDDAEDFVREEAGRKADRALRADINQRVLSWVDTIARRGGPGSAILPVALIPSSDTDTVPSTTTKENEQARRHNVLQAEVERRCNMLQDSLMEFNERYSADAFAPKLLLGADSQVLCVQKETGYGIERLRETIIEIGTDTSRSVFDHVGAQVPNGTAQVLNSIRRFKENHKLILLDHLLGDVGEHMDVNEVLEALQFLSSIGEVQYYGASNDDVLSRYIVLSRKWLVSALSCILRNDLRRELAETRRFMNMQCIYSNHKFLENEVIQTLSGGTLSSVPLLSNEDAKMLWQSMSFMREAADHYSQLSENSTSTPTMFYFLERLLVHSGIFLPLGASQPNEFDQDRSEVFFVPSLLAQVNPTDAWTYKCKESWMTTLCHSWLFRDGVPANMMEILTVNVLRDLYQFSTEFHSSLKPDIPTRAVTVPMRNASMTDFMAEHDDGAVGRVRIREIVCWNSSLLVKVGTVFADQETNDLRESFLEVFVAIVDQSTNHCVASDAMRANMQRVVVSGKGQVGHNGRKIWQGGYDVILKSVKESLSCFSNVDFQVVCPDCLGRSNPRSASTWSWDNVYAVAQRGEPVVRCMRGHRLSSHLICGTSPERKQAPVVETASLHRSCKPVSEIFPSVVLVGLWDPESKEIRSVGSGFIVDRRLGLVVTAGHVLFNMESGRNFGRPYFGLPSAKVVIGVIPDKGTKAVFRYFGEIVSDDIQCVDACVVRIKTRMEQDVDDNGRGCADQPEQILTLDAIPDEDLKALKLTSRWEVEEGIRVVGYNQGGEGIMQKGKHVNRSADFAKGYLVRKFEAPIPDDDSNSSSSSSHHSFNPREEIVIMCPTIAGHSGGPCVNDEGKVVGILSRADPTQPERCYLVPATEIKGLVSSAKTRTTSRPTLGTLNSL